MTENFNADIRGESQGWTPPVKVRKNEKEKGRRRKKKIVKDTIALLFLAPGERGLGGELYLKELVF